MAVHRRRRHPGLALLDLEPTDILGGRTIRGAAKEGGETRDDALIVVLGLR
jgi:hypothetical protein